MAARHKSCRWTAHSRVSASMPYLPHHEQRHQSLTEWRRERKERQCVSPSRGSTAASKGISLWRHGSGSAKKGRAFLHHAPPLAPRLQRRPDLGGLGRAEEPDQAGAANGGECRWVALMTWYGPRSPISRVRFIPKPCNVESPTNTAATKHQPTPTNATNADQRRPTTRCAEKRVVHTQPENDPEYPSEA